MKKRQILFPNRSDIEKMNEIAIELFGTEEDETQADPSIETALKLISIDKYNFICLKEGDDVIAWSVVLPTSKKAMDEFLEGKINEKELFEFFRENPSFEALYLAAAIVLPEHRRQGLGSFLMKEQIEYFKGKHRINSFYAMILTEEGKKLMESIKRDTNEEILYTSRV